MEQYIIVKQFAMGDKTYYVNRILSSENTKESTIKRLVKKGYIKPIEKMSVNHEEPPAYEEADGFLSPEEVNKLKKPDLIGYAKHIGVENFDPGAGVAEQREIVNSFIADKADGDEDND